MRSKILRTAAVGSAVFKGKGLSEFRFLTMKAKVISGLLAMVFGVTMVALCFTPVFTIALACFTLLANYELLHATGVKNKGVYVLTTIPSAGMPFILTYDLIQYSPVPLIAILLVYVFILLILMLIRYEETRFEHISMALVSSLLVPYVMSLLCEIRDFFPDAPQSTRAFLMVYTLICAWLTDAMAYFVGVKFGKHKMSPKISPKKTWEGAIGGVLGTIVLNIVIYGVYYLLFRFGWIQQLLVPLWLIPILTAFLSVIGMLGDLSASVIKRNYNVKDYGFIMGEGNGGVMDRFDSGVFVIGAMYVLLLIYRAAGLHF